MVEATPSGEWWRGVTLPSHLATERLVLRAFAPGDGPFLKASIDANLEHLRPSMPWAADEPSPLDVIEARVQRFAATFGSGPDWGYAVRLAGVPEIVGGCGMHARIGANALEIGYWLDGRLTGRGYATEAVRALASAAFTQAAIDRLEIRCGPENTASAAIPRRLGFVYVVTLEKNFTTRHGEPRDTMVFELTRASYLNRASEHTTR